MKRNKEKKYMYEEKRKEKNVSMSKNKISSPVL
jgi:hypothetical protein